jgi:predicted outer membrane protein
MQRGNCRSSPSGRPSAGAGGAKPTDPQIAHIAYTAGVLNINAAKQALKKSGNKEVNSSRRTWCATMR